MSDAALSDASVHAAMVLPPYYRFAIIASPNEG